MAVYIERKGERFLSFLSLIKQVLLAVREVQGQWKGRAAGWILWNVITQKMHPQGSLFWFLTCLLSESHTPSNLWSDDLENNKPVNRLNSHHTCKLPKTEFTIPSDLLACHVSAFASVQFTTTNRVTLAASGNPASVTALFCISSRRFVVFMSFAMQL